MKNLKDLTFVGFVVNRYILMIKSDIISLSHHYQCHITGKYRGSAQWSCNINLKISENIPVMFHNLKGYESQLIVKRVE